MNAIRAIYLYPPRLYVRAPAKGTATDDPHTTMWLAESVLASAGPKQR